MIKKLVKVYLSKLLRFWDYQVLSLQTELSFNDKVVDVENDKTLIKGLDEALLNRRSIRRVLELISDNNNDINTQI